MAATVAMVLILVVAAVAIVYEGRFPSSQPSQRSEPLAVTFSPELNRNFECPHDAAWSPNGEMIAIIGYNHTCLGGATGEANPYRFNMLPASTPGLVEIYDTRTGQLLKTIQPDELILTQIKLPASVVALLTNPQLNSGPVLTFNYMHVLWSHDGQQIAITFNGFIPTGVPTTDSAQSEWPGYQIDGVLTLDVSGATSHVLLKRFDPNHPSYTEWDLSQSVALPPQEALQSTSLFSTLSLAARYTWGSEGSLSLESLLASRDVFASAVGSTSGGTSFSLWQSGYAVPLGANQLGSNTPTWGAYATDIAAWSPDGRYLLERGTVETLVTTAPHMDTFPDGWQGAPTITAIPAGLAQVYLKLGHQSDMPGATFIAAQQPLTSGIPVSWNPTGNLIAAYSMSLAHVFIFDALTGVQVASLKPTSNLNATQTYQGAEASMLRWSPDGLRLLLYDPTIGSATIWKVPHK